MVLDLYLAHPLLGILVVLVLLAALTYVAGCVRYIPNNKVAVVERLWSPKGSLARGLIALDGEAGYQAEVLRGGYHFFFPFMYKVHPVALITVRPGSLAYVFARDGQPLGNGQILAANDQAADFQDARAFLTGGGQQGPQRRVLLAGTYAINVAQFVVLTEDTVHSLPLGDDERATIGQLQATLADRDGFQPVVIKDADDAIGVVTVHDGPALPPGEIIAPEVGTDPAQAAQYHNSFQDPEKFIRAGGCRGKQLQVLVDGTYAINRLFATVERFPKTVIPMGSVGVVASYTGPAGTDVSGDEYRHGQLVERGARGVWKEPLLTGKYAFNPLAGHITLVPTTNLMLKWKKDDSGGSHNLDENLAEITLITKDAFTIMMSLSVVIHIDYAKASLLIQRFGNVKTLIEGTLDPIVSGYFKNIGQTKTVIELMQQRTGIQDQALVVMQTEFARYSIDVSAVVIGTPRGPDLDRIFDQLKQRQIAAEQVETFQLQQKAAEQKKQLNEAESVAAMQAALTESAIKVKVSDNDGAAAVARARQDADRIRILAEADKQKLVLQGEGEGQRLTSIGLAEAEAGRAKVESYGGPDIRLAEILGGQFFQAIQSGGVALVPQVQVGASQGAGGTMEALLALFVKDQLSRLRGAIPTQGGE